MTTIEEDNQRLMSSIAYNPVYTSGSPVEVATPRCFYPTNSSGSISTAKTNNLDFEVPNDYFNMYSFIGGDTSNTMSSPMSPTTLTPSMYGKLPNLPQQLVATNSNTNTNRLEDLNEMALDEVFLTQQSFAYPSLPMEPLVSVPVLASNTQPHPQPVEQKHHQEENHLSTVDQVLPAQPHAMTDLLPQKYTPGLFQPHNNNNNNPTSISSSYTVTSTLPTTVSNPISEDEMEEEDDEDDDEDDGDYDYETSFDRRRSLQTTSHYSAPPKRNASVPSISHSGHRRLSKNAKLFKCDSCSSSFTRKTRLTEHKNRVHLGKVYHFECKLCGVRLSSKENLTRHKIVHTDKFKCNKCDRRFDRSYRFHRHVEKCDGSV